MNAKLISKGLVAVIILILALSAASVSFAKGGGNSSVPADDWFDVEYRGMTDNGDGTSTWTYWVEEIASGKGVKDLSHWALPLVCDDSHEPPHTVIDADPKPYEVGANPHNKDVYSIKWDVSDDFVSGEFSVTLEGVWQEMVVEAATKAGRHVTSEWTTGPSCVPMDDDGGDDLPTEL